MEMKSHKIFGLLLLFFVSNSLSGQELETILERHFKAVNQEKMAKVETMITTGTSIYAPGGIESPFTITQARPNRVRKDSDFQGSKVIQTYNGNNGWIYAPGMRINEPKEMTADELETLLNQSEFGSPLWNYSEKGHTLELVGEADADKETFHLKLTTSGDEILNFHINRKSYLITSFKTYQVMGGTETTIEVVMSEFKNVKGIALAHSIVTRMNGQTVYTITKDQIVLNKKLEPYLFDKPQLN